jgi:hypothetical protein
MRTGWPLLFIGALLTIGSGAALVVRTDFNTEELAAAFILMGAGLVMLGSWAAIEIKTLKGGNRLKTAEVQEESDDSG